MGKEGCEGRVVRWRSAVVVMVVVVVAVSEKALDRIQTRRVDDTRSGNRIHNNTQPKVAQAPILSLLPLSAIFPTIGIAKLTLQLSFLFGTWNDTASPRRSRGQQAASSSVSE